MDLPFRVKATYEKGRFDFQVRQLLKVGNHCRVGVDLQVAALLSLIKVVFAFPMLNVMSEQLLKTMVILLALISPHPFDFVSAP